MSAGFATALDRPPVVRLGSDGSQR
jgi:hypothetical protein